jgi:hypothetical protein
MTVISFLFDASCKVSLHVLESPALTSGFNSRHFPPFDANEGSGSVRTDRSRSSLRSSLLAVSRFCIRAMFLGSGILAAAVGIIFEKRDRSRVAAADRTIGGRNSDIASSLATRLSSCRMASVRDNDYFQVLAHSYHHVFMLLCC